ncbi:hypothetical protein [Streptomyces longwoodensis]|uniref:hypothetical protein n=1 Tax=Streptomyces longwoodensis TaxID=68231 RepID=UPI0034083122
MLALLAVVPLTGAASAVEQDDHASRSPLRSVAVTITEHSESKTVTDGEVSAVEESAASGVSHFFSPQAPDYRGDSAYGHLTGQVRYHDGDHMSFAWGLKLNAATAAQATGLMSESATATRNGRSFGYSDSHGAIGANYLVHSSFRVNTSRYVLTVKEHFPIARGEKYITTVFDFTVTLI